MVEELRSIVALASALVDARALGDSHVAFAQLCAALDHVEQLLFHHKGAFGVQSPRFQLGCEEFVLLSNTFAMRALQQRQQHAAASQQELELCGDLLSRAEQHTWRSGYLRSIPEAHHVTRRRAFRLASLNNLACYHKEAGKPLAALGFLEKVLHLQRRQAAASTTLDGDNEAIAPEQDAQYAIALTHLNLCAVLAQLDRHAAAAQHARSAIALLDVQNDGDDNRVDEKRRAPPQSHLVLIAHFNLAVELEHLSDGAQAQRMYETALALARATTASS